MEYERKGITISWKIENLGNIHITRMELYSPVFSLGKFEGTKWRLRVHQITNRNTCLTLKREAYDDGPEKFELHFQFSVNAFDELSSIGKTGFLAHAFLKDRMCERITVNHTRMFTCNTLTIQCKLWSARGSIENSDQFVVRTRLATESYTFFGRIEKFSDFCRNNAEKVQAVLTPTSEKVIPINLSFHTSNVQINETIMDIEINHFSNKTKRLINIRIFIVDSSGNKIGVSKFKVQFRMDGYSSFVFPSVWKENIMTNANRYLKHDTLSLYYEFTFWSGIEYENIEETVFETDSVSEINPTDLSKGVELLTLKNGIPCDTLLQTATETFPVHTDILSSQSPVFEAMFKSNMREAIQKCVRILDIDAETVKRMLVFMYTETLEEMGWKDAMKLYSAADKYQILHLKQKCAIFLKETIDLSNCCVFLHLADSHQDQELDRAVKTFITEYSLEVLHCDQWKSLERNLPHLAIETLRDLLFDTINFQQLLDCSSDEDD